MAVSVAIDGYSGSGKSTLAKQLAKKIGYLYLDTGAMYRAIALKVLETAGTDFSVSDISKIVRSTTLTIEQNDSSGNRIILDGKDVSDRIREPDVAGIVSPVAAQPQVRLFLVSLQRRIARGKNVVLEGRDIGTVVLPRASFKFFVTADINERARRRFLELQEKGIKSSLDDVKKNLAERDHIDTTRETSPLRKADDAIEIDSTNLTQEEQLNTVYRIIRKSLWEKSIPIYWLYRGIVRIVVKLFFGLEIHYQNFEAVRHFSGLVASNHCSNIDPPAVGISVPFGMCYFAKEELNTNFIMKLIFKKIPMLWVNRDNPTPASIKQTIDALQDGRPLLVFPEGTRSPDGTIQQAKSGAGMIACKAMVPILPVYVEGTYDILPKGASMPKFHKVRVYVGTPYKLETSPFSGKSKKEIYQLASAEMIERIIAIKNNKLR